MAIESATYISDLVITNPVGSTDYISTLDDHDRLIKKCIKNSFPNITGAVTATHTELNQLAGTVPVVTTGSQTIEGAKKFTSASGVVIEAAAPYLALSETTDSYGDFFVVCDNGNLNIRYPTTGTSPYALNIETTAGTISSVKILGETAWHAGNDGSGSGLDADTVDGVQAAALATLASPTFTGTPAAPTAGAGTDTTQIATTAFVQAAVAASGGAVKEIVVATSSPSSALDASYATVETVTLTNVSSGSNVVVFAIGIYTVSSQIISQKITNTSDTIKSVGESSTHAINISNASLVSIAYDSSPGTGSKTYWLRAKEAANVSGTIDHAIMVAVEYTP